MTSKVDDSISSCSAAAAKSNKSEQQLSTRTQADEELSIDFMALYNFPCDTI